MGNVWGLNQSTPALSLNPGQRHGPGLPPVARQGEVGDPTWCGWKLPSGGVGRPVVYAPLLGLILGGVGP